MDGFINIYKERGYTSFDVVAKLRGILRQKKIGHTGTLDPNAEGVLLVCLGKATKLCDMLVEKSKAYRCVMLLGTTTDTEDTTGQVLEVKDVDVNEEEVWEAIMSFLGDYQQIPPMYSAIKVDGKKLYEYARKGVTIERAPRPVEIYEIEIENVDLPRVIFTVKCSKGTYIRSLCRDIGEKLGCGATMEKLVRTEVKEFTIAESLTLDQVEEARDNGTLSDHIYSMDLLLSELPKMHIKNDEGIIKLLSNGNPLKAEAFEEDEIIKDTNVRVYDAAGEFKALYAFNEEKGLYKPYKMFL